MRKPKALGAIIRRILLVVVILWGASMGCAAYQMARQYARAAKIDGKAFAAEIGKWTGLDEIYTEDSAQLNQRNPQIRTWQDYDMLKALARVENPSGTGGGYALQMGEYYGEEVAAVFCDQAGNILYECGDYLLFTMCTQEAWEESWRNPEIMGHGMIDLEAEENGQIADYLRETGNFGWLRVTGYVNGMQVTPLKLDYISYDQVPSQSEAETFDHHSLIWETLFDNTAGADPEKMVTFYTGELTVSLYNAGSTIRTRPWDDSQEDSYDTLRHLLRDRARGAVLFGDIYNNAMASRITETVIFGTRYYRLDGAGDKEKDLGEADFILVTASVYRPLRSAVYALHDMAVMTLLLGIVLGLVLCWSINRNLIWHVRKVNWMSERGWEPTEFGNLEPWQEASQLQRNYHKTADQIQKQKNEVARLEAALSYAKEAENNRRQMVSSIAHELKTPLAVVHSYAEGLQEKIAEEKREQYLQTILTETERMDAMVMEMLDLSRLEAGKVKLARDRFDLAEMVRDSFEKLQPMAEEKKLNIQFQLKENCMVAADEGRIAQAVMNLASNAVRYTPAGGNITVTLGLVWRQTVLTVANDCMPFAEDELEKVWESFYRRDKSRDRKGTGLGLAITKQILQLHGGSCYVKNTESGVEFGITLPN